MFAHHYLRNLVWFFFLRLLRCFSSPRIIIYFVVLFPLGNLWIISLFLTPHNFSLKLKRPYSTYQDIRIQHKKKKKNINKLYKYRHFKLKEVLIISSNRFPYHYLVTTSQQSSTAGLQAVIMTKGIITLKQKIIRYNNKIKIPHLCLLTPNSTAWRAVCTRACKYSPLHDDKRLLAIPTSCFRITENNLN